MITPTQCHQARRMLGWSFDELGLFVCVRAIHISQFEAGRLDLSPSQQGALRRMFEAAGVMFVDAHPAGRGAIFRPPPAPGGSETYASLAR
jgi:ribosome-binding protein aMBF1 (putative translation factor)